MGCGYSAVGGVWLQWVGCGCSGWDVAAVGGTRLQWVGRGYSGWAGRGCRAVGGAWLQSSGWGVAAGDWVGWLQCSVAKGMCFITYKSTLPKVHNQFLGISGSKSMITEIVKSQLLCVRSQFQSAAWHW